jgi:hypothetical protein
MVVQRVEKKVDSLERNLVDLMVDWMVVQRD